MPSQKISQLPAVITPLSTDEFPVNQGGVTKKETGAQIGATIDHDALLNFVANEHLLPAAIDHDILLNFVVGEHFLQSAIVATGILNAGSIASGFGNIDLGSSTLRGGTVGIGVAPPVSPILLHVAAGAKASAGEQVRFNLGTDEAGTLELAVRVMGNAVAADRFCEIQSIEQGVGGRDIVLNPSGGSVGIGTNAPDSLLDVAGELVVDDRVGIGIAPIAGVRLLLPQENGAATPTLAFGDGDSGLFERLDNEIGIAIAGAEQFFWTGSLYRGLVTAGPALFNRAAAVTTPTLLPASNDTNTGIGHRAADILNVVAGALECAEFANVGAAAAVGFYGTAAIVRQTGVAVSAAGIHAALVNLGLFTA